MLINELNIILSCLVVKERYTVDRLINESGLSRLQVSKALKRLLLIGVLCEDEGGILTVADHINPVIIVKAAKIGIALVDFKGELGIKSEDISLALKITEKIDNINQISVENRYPLIQTRKYLTGDINFENDSTYVNLMCMIETVNHLLVDYLHELSKADKELLILLQTLSVAESELRDYVKSKLE